MKRALILDLDNTIYPVSSISENLFAQLFELLDSADGVFNYENLILAKEDLKRRHFHLVAEKFNFGDELTTKGIELLKRITYTLPMQPFDEYHYIQSIPLAKFLVTMGFSNLQWSKVKMLGIEADFEEIHIVDPEVSKKTKKDVFADIIKRHQYAISDVLVIGDDPESEIKAATALGIDTFLFDPENLHASALVTHRSAQLKDVPAVI